MNIKIKLTRPENLARFNVSKGAIVELDFEREYLPVVVSSEVYESRTPLEGMKAQAIAARTYAYEKMLAGVRMDDTTKYQAFKWKDLSAIPNCAEAVKQTAGQVLCYQGKAIAAYFTNSNKGRCKQSGEVWRSDRPWLSAQDDPWDTAARVKYGEPKSYGHGVGLSQMGAEYAASIGVDYRAILQFYYPGTDITAGYGESGVISPGSATGGDGMSEKTNLGLVEWAQQWVGQAYWYGSCCYDCTSGLLDRKKVQYPSHYTEDRIPRYHDDIAKGRKCADCIGLIKGYIWDQGGKQVYDKDTDTNTTGLFNRATVKGTIDTIPEVPGLIVYKQGHVGVYVGNGDVIEAKGFAHGVIRSKLTDTKWTHWLQHPSIVYGEAVAASRPVTYPYKAKVVNVKTRLNLRSEPKNADNTICMLELGTVVEVLEDNCGNGFSKVRYGDMIGYCTRSYLYQIETEPKTDEQKPTTPPIGAIALLVVSVAGAIAALWPKIKAWWRRIWRRENN